MRSMSRHRWERIAERALTDRRPRVADLLAALDEVNPTPHAHLDDEERDARYALKARLQTRLIERFPRDLELRPDGDAWLLSLRGGRDAKHVLRHQLGETAQAWFSAELLRHHAGPEEPAATRPVERSRAPAPTEDEVEERMGEGDYEGAAALLGRRARAGDAGAGARMLELLLDYLDEPEEAARRAEELPDQPTVRAAWAVALARCGRLDEAEGVLRGVDHSSAAPAWRELGHAWARGGDADRARRAADRMVALDPGLLTAADDLKRDVAARLARSLAAELTALAAAMAAEVWDEAERLARLLIERDGDSAPAKAALASVRQVRRSERVARLVEEGAALERAGRWREAASAFGEAGRDERAAQALSRAQDEERERRLAAVAAALATNLRAGLEAHDALGEPERAAVRVPERARPAVAWLEALPAGKPAARAAAVLALLDAEADLAGGRPDEALARLEPHGLVARCRSAKRVVEAAREAVVGRRAAEALAIVERAAASDDDGVARRELAAVSVKDLDGPGRERYRAVDRAIARREAEAGRLAAWQGAMASDPLSALGLAEAAEGADWTERRRLAEAAVRAAWCVRDVPLGVDVPDLITPTVHGGPSVSLDLARGLCWIAEQGGREWIAVHAVAIGGGPVARALMFRPPRQTLVYGVQLRGGELWIDHLGGVFRLDLERAVVTGELGGGNRLPSFVVTEANVWAKWDLATTRWTRLDDPRHPLADVVVVAAAPGRPDPVAQWPDGSIAWLSSTGARRPLARGTERFGSADRLAAAAPHPVDPDGAVLVVEHPEQATVEVIGVTDGARSIARRLRAAQDVTVATSTETGLVYLLEPGRPGRVLTALTPEGSTRFSVALRCVSPALYTDPEGRRVALVVDVASGPHVALLGDEPPVLPDLGIYHEHGARSDDCAVILPPELDELAEAFEFGGPDLDARLDAAIAELGEPLRVIELVVGFLHLWPSRCEAVFARHGLSAADHPLLAYAAAHGAHEARDFDRVAEVLDLDVDALPPELRRHALHLRALAALAQGRLEAARGDLRLAARHDGECPIDDTALWLGVLELSDPQAPPPDDEVTRSWWEIRAALARAAADPSAAVDVLSVPPVARCEHQDVCALRARALLEDDRAPWFLRVRAFDRLREGTGDAPIPEALGGEERRRVLAAAAAWLAEAR